MATTFKTFLSNDVTSTRTLLHEAIPVTGTIVSGTYSDNNIKNFGHGMFQAVYDYPFLSSSSNHLFDITCGYSSNSALSKSSNVSQNAKKINIYNQMAQVLMGHTTASTIQEFDEDGDLVAGGTKIREAYFLTFSRLLVKDEIKKGSFEMTFLTGGSAPPNTAGAPDGETAPLGVVTPLTYNDSGSTTSYKVNSPAGEYGIIYDVQGRKQGLIFYQAGVVVLTGSCMRGASVSTSDTNLGYPYASFDTGSVDRVLSGTTIQNNSNAIRTRLKNVQFNNSTELNSTIYFCRANHNEYNYSSNPTYISSSKIVVKNVQQDSPVAYLTTVGLYSANNELLAVAKLSEPLKKSPSTELTIRVRLDY